MDIFTLYIVLVVLSLHYIADFICQSHEEAVNKSSSIAHLVDHVYKYTMIVFAGLQVFIILPLINFGATNYHPDVVGWWGVVLNLLVMFYIFITHLATDYITSRINAKLWKRGKMHEFFNCVGLDQLIHCATLFILLNQIL